MLKRFHKAFFTPGLIKESDFDEQRSGFEKYRRILAMDPGFGYRKWAILVFGSIASAILLTMVHLPLSGLQVDVWSMMWTEYRLNYVLAVIGALFALGIVVGNMIWYGIGCAVSAHKMLNIIKESKHLKVTSVSEDGEGGFHVLAQFSFALFLICISILPHNLAWMFTFGATREFLIEFPLLWSAMGFAFFYPLWPAHSVMKTAKESELRHISELFEEYYDRYISLSPGDQDVDEVLAKMNNIEARYERAKKMQVWPFHIRTLDRLLSLAPLITFLIRTLSIPKVRELIAKLWAR